MTLVIPKEYASDLADIKAIQGECEKTHPHLSDMLLTSVVFDSADRMLLVVGVSGTGKSTVCEWIEKNSTRDTIHPQSASINGLKFYEADLNMSRRSICIEDLATDASLYMQVRTVGVIASLVYTGHIEKHASGFDLDISGFQGSALVYGQPVIMALLVKEVQFESNIRDKVIRYYHLVRPLNAVLEGEKHPLTFKHPYSYIDKVEIVATFTPQIKKWFDRAVSQMEYEVSHARAIEHCYALMKASAVINHRREVREADAWLVAQLTRNMQVEQYLYVKQDLEGPRFLDPNLLPLLTDLASTREPSVKDIAKRTGITEKRAYAIIKGLNTWVLLNTKHIHPTKECKQILGECGIWQG